jgi:hypothetical protein
MDEKVESLGELGAGRFDLAGAGGGGLRQVDLFEEGVERGALFDDRFARCFCGLLISHGFPFAKLFR